MIPALRMVPPPPWITTALDTKAYDSEYSAAAREHARRQAIRNSAQLHQISTDACNYDLSKHNRYCEFYSIATAHMFLVHDSDLQDVPFDRTRVIPRNSRYVSACWVRELHGGKTWIVQQTSIKPERLIYYFLLMLMEPSDGPTYGTCDPSPHRYRIRTVIQLGSYRDDNGRKHDCQYLPKHVGSSKVFPREPPWQDRASIRVTLVSRQAIKRAKCVQSTVNI